jgi:hypothetical protein
MTGVKMKGDRVDSAATTNRFLAFWKVGTSNFSVLLHFGFIAHRQRSSHARPATDALLIRPEPLTDSSPAMEVD